MEIQIALFHSLFKFSIFQHIASFAESNLFLCIYTAIPLFQYICIFLFLLVTSFYHLPLPSCSRNLRAAFPIFSRQTTETEVWHISSEIYVSKTADIKMKWNVKLKENSASTWTFFHHLLLFPIKKEIFLGKFKEKQMCTKTL